MNAHKPEPVHDQMEMIRQIECMEKLFEQNFGPDANVAHRVGEYTTPVGVSPAVELFRFLLRSHGLTELADLPDNLKAL